MLFAPDGAVVIELPLKPHVDRNMGYLAAALGLDYYVVPGVAAFYYGTYSMDDSLAEEVTRTLLHVIATHGLQHLLLNSAQDEL